MAGLGANFEFDMRRIIASKPKRGILLLIIRIVGLQAQ